MDGSATGKLQQKKAGRRDCLMDGNEKRWEQTVEAGIKQTIIRLRELGARGFGGVTVTAAKTGHKWEITETLSERVEV